MFGGKEKTMYILKNLWYGNVNPGERFSRLGSEYKKVAAEANTYMELLAAEMTPKGAEYLEKLLDKNMVLSSISEEDAFIRGVRIGAQFILDVVSDYKSQLPSVDEE